MTRCSDFARSRLTKHRDRISNKEGDLDRAEREEWQFWTQRVEHSGRVRICCSQSRGARVEDDELKCSSLQSKREASSRPFGNGKGPTTTPKVPALFQPLINAIEQHEAAGFNRPLRSQVAAKLGRAWAGQFSNFKEYALAAQARGLVKMGDGEKLGREWIQLRHSKA